MSLTPVQGRVLTPAQTPIAYAQVTARLIAPAGAFLAADGVSELTASATAVTAADGTWTLQLTPQAEIAPAGSYYQLRVQTALGLTTLVVAVPVSATPVPVGSILIDPTTLDPVAGGASLYLQRVERGVADGVAALGLDGKVPASQLPAAAGGSGGGFADSLVLDRTAGASALSGHRVVVPTSATVVGYADNATASHLGAPLWLTLAAAAAGAPVQVQALGLVVEPSWLWTRGPVYLGTAGQVTQTPPTTAGGALFLAICGFALDATTVAFDPRPSITLS